MSNREMSVWFKVLTILLILSNVVVFGALSIVDPELPWPDRGDGAAFPIQFFAVRHLAFGIVLFWAFWKKEWITLRALYSLFLIISILDIALLFWKGYYIPLLVHLVRETSPIVSAGLAAVLFLIPMSVSLWYVNRKLASERVLS